MAFAVASQERLKASLSGVCIYHPVNVVQHVESCPDFYFFVSHTPFLGPAGHGDTKSIVVAFCHDNTLSRRIAHHPLQTLF
jgi:hypothetical protein